jgi:hypothetical protein
VVSVFEFPPPNVCEMLIIVSPPGQFGQPPRNTLQNDEDFAWHTSWKRNVRDHSSKLVTLDPEGHLCRSMAKSLADKIRSESLCGVCMSLSMAEL